MSINSRIHQLRTHLGLTQSELADALGVTRSYITHLESGRNSPSYNVLDSLMDRYAASADWLMRGKGEMILTNRVHPSVHLSVHPIATSGQLGVQEAGQSASHEKKLVETLIPVIPVAAAAGFGLGNSQTVMEHDIIDHLHFPGAKAGRVAFPVSGDSMFPTLEEGDFVVCRRAEKREISRGLLVLAALGAEVYIKRANPTDDNLFLTSDNPLYPPVVFPFSEHPALYVVEKVVRISDDPQPKRQDAVIRHEMELLELRMAVQQLQKDSKAAAN